MEAACKRGLELPAALTPNPQWGFPLMEAGPPKLWGLMGPQRAGTWPAAAPQERWLAGSLGAGRGLAWQGQAHAMRGRELLAGGAWRWARRPLPRLAPD